MSRWTCWKSAFRKSESSYKFPLCRKKSDKGGATCKMVANVPAQATGGLEWATRPPVILPWVGHPVQSMAGSLPFFQFGNSQPDFPQIFSM